MFQKRDLSQVWANVPNRDIEETRAAKKPAAPAVAAPLVHVGTVQGNVITINTSAGIDLASLLKKASESGDTAST